MTPSDQGAPVLQVVATAGHVDHGKSALILRLTGMDPDRLAEEKRRGLTIDLGFAWTRLPSGREMANPRPRVTLKIMVVVAPFR